MEDATPNDQRKKKKRVKERNMQTDAQTYRQADSQTERERERGETHQKKLTEISIWEFYRSNEDAGETNNSGKTKKNFFK